MKTEFIKINGIHDLYELVTYASHVDGDVIIRRGKYAIDGKSIMGVMSLDLSTGAEIEYPDDATEFSEFIANFVC